MSKKQEREGLPSGRRFSDQFKAEAVAMVTELGKSQRQVAAELGMGHTTLSRWVADARTPEPDVVPRDVVAMEARIRKLEQENSFLKKAAAFFAQESLLD